MISKKNLTVILFYFSPPKGLYEQHRQYQSDKHKYIKKKVNKMIIFEVFGKIEFKLLTSLEESNVRKLLGGRGCILLTYHPRKS